MNSTIRSWLTTTVFSGTLLALAPAARAHDAEAGRPLEPVVTVHYADLNPGTPAGVGALYERIKDAAQTVCGPSFSLWDSNAYPNWKICYRATIDHTVQQINLPLLTAMHQKTGHALQAQAR